MMKPFTHLWEWLHKDCKKPEEVVLRFDSVHEFTKEDEEALVNLVLSKKDTREIIEKYIFWKIGVCSREAQRSDDDKYTFGRKERVQVLGEITADFMKAWKRVNTREEEAALKNV